MCIETIKSGSRACKCGCGQLFATFSGLLRYGVDNLVAFHAGASMSWRKRPSLMLIFGSGPRFNDDPRGCWLTLHTWVAEGQINCKSRGA